LKVKPTPKRTKKNYVSFLNDIAKSPHRKIFIVGHAGTLQGICSILMNVDFYGDITNELIVKNCSVMCVSYDDKKQNYKLISKPNALHIK